MQAIAEQMELFAPEPEERLPKHELLPLNEYDVIVVEFSGGKDSGKAVFDLLDMGIERERIVLWHQCTDGDPRAVNPLLRMDWPVTTHYCKLFAEKLGLRIEFQWREWGIAGELFRINRGSKPVSFEYDGETTILPTTERSERSTRMRWPAQAADLRTRWCSAVSKIDVAARAMNNHPEFQRFGMKVLVITGERREESAARAKYAEALPYRSNCLKRRVDQWRMILDATEEEVWESWRRYDILPHPAYLLGWSRCSCFGCIFNHADHWAMMLHLDPEFFESFVQVEEYLQHTLDSKRTLTEKAAAGKLDRMPIDDPQFETWRRWALSKDAMTLDDLDGFVMPAGAFLGGEGGAP